MPQTQAPQYLQSTIQKADEWLTDLAGRTGRDDPQKNWQMLRAVLHVLRDRVTVEQCAHLSAQLPLIVRGLYFEGWRPAGQPRPLRSRDEFVRAVGEELSAHPEIDPHQAIKTVLGLLAGRITRGELEKIQGMLQPEIQALWPDT